MTYDNEKPATIEHVDGYYEARFQRFIEHAQDEVWSMLIEPSKFVLWLAPGEIEPRTGGSAKLDFADSGIIIDSCPDCGGIWLDACELESIQALVEGWEEKLPEDLAEHRALLEKVKVDQDLADDTQYSRFGFINFIINGVVDKVIMR